MYPSIEGGAGVGLPFLMAMSATTTASAIVIAAIASAAIASTSTSSASEHVDHAFNLVGCGGTILYYFANEGEVLACQAVVEVDDNLFLFHLQYEALEMVAILVYQGYECTWIDVF